MARSGTNHKGGRPKGSKGGHTIAAEKAREFVIKTVAKNLHPLLEAKLDLAFGHKFQSEEGRVYTKSPDGNSIQYLLNQGIGKPTETLKVDADYTLKIDI